MRLTKRLSRLSLAISAVGLSVAAGLIVGIEPARATVVDTESTGWHVGAPSSLGYCGAWRNLATGSDVTKWMQARVCIRTIGVGDQTQATVHFHNQSSSTATAKADSQGYAEGASTTWATLYTCGSYTLPAKGDIYCRGRINRLPVPSANTFGGTTGNATVNGHGGSLTRPAKPRLINRALTDRIVSIAMAESNNAAHNREIGGEDCNYYSGALGVGKSCGSQGWRAEDWCADFARWVYGQAGVKTSGLSAGAASFKNAAATRYRPGRIAANVGVGDAILYRLGDSTSANDHVGIVVAVNGDQITTIEGNSQNRVRAWTFNPASVSDVSGFASPTVS